MVPATVVFTNGSIKHASGWKSGNHVDYLAITAHFLDEQYLPKTMLLVLRNTFGNKTGEEQKHHLHEVLREFKI
ncbi:hypothetical protein LTR35_018394, partial [Friedmanniomyces endolithicus]